MYPHHFSTNMDFLESLKSRYILSALISYFLNIMRQYLNGDCSPDKGALDNSDVV